MAALYIEIYFDPRFKSWKTPFLKNFEVSQGWHKIGIYSNTKQNIQPMKNISKTTAILKTLDLELKALLSADLGNFKAKSKIQKQLQAKQAAWSIILSSTYEEKEFHRELFFYDVKLKFIEMKSDSNTYFDKHFDCPLFCIRVY